MMGEHASPGDSISYTTPQVVSPASGFPVGGLYDYLGLPTVGQTTAGATVSVSAFWSRAYNLIYNTWFRDENLQNSVTVDTGDGPDTYSNYALKRRGKRFDYFTGCLPWPQKGSTAVFFAPWDFRPCLRHWKGAWFDEWYYFLWSSC